MADQVSAALHGTPDPDEAWLNHPGLPKEGTKGRMILEKALRGATMQEIVLALACTRQDVHVACSDGRKRGLKAPWFKRDGEPYFKDGDVDKQEHREPRVTFVGKRRERSKPETVASPTHDRQGVLLDVMFDVLKRKPANDTQAAGYFYAAQALAEHARRAIHADG